jgi:hypothetical protein
MRRSRFSEEQIAMALRQADAATRLAMETRGDCFFSVSSRLAYLSSKTFRFAGSSRPY